MIFIVSFLALKAKVDSFHTLQSSTFPASSSTVAKDCRIESVRKYRNSEDEHTFNLKEIEMSNFRPLKQRNKSFIDENIIDSIYDLAKTFQGVLVQKTLLREKIEEYQMKRKDMDGIITSGQNMMLNAMEEEVSRVSMIINTVTKRSRRDCYSSGVRDIPIESFGNIITNEPGTKQQFYIDKNAELDDSESVKLKEELDVRVKEIREKIAYLQTQIDSKKQDLEKYEMMHQNYQQIKLDLDDAWSTLNRRQENQEDKALKSLTSTLLGALNSSDIEMSKMKIEAVQSKRKFEEEQNILQNQLDKILARLSNADDDVIAIIQSLWILRNGQF